MEYEGKLYGKVGCEYFPMEETTKDIGVLREKAKKFDKLDEMIAVEMEKPDNESDLIIIGEMIINEFGYSG